MKVKKNNAYINREFEKTIKYLFHLQGIEIYRLSNVGAQTLSSGSFEKILCDFICGLDGSTLLFNVKVVSKGGLTYSNIYHSQTAEHELKLMHRFFCRGGCFNAGYIVLFEKDGYIVFFNINQCFKLQPKKSLQVDDGEIIAGFKNDCIDMGGEYDNGFLSMFNEIRKY